MWTTVTLCWRPRFYPIKNTHTVTIGWHWLHLCAFTCKDIEIDTHREIPIPLMDEDDNRYTNHLTLCFACYFSYIDEKAYYILIPCWTLWSSPTLTIFFSLRIPWLPSPWLRIPSKPHDLASQLTVIYCCTLALILHSMYVPICPLHPWFTILLCCYMVHYPSSIRSVTKPTSLLCSTLSHASKYRTYK